MKTKLTLEVNFSPGTDLDKIKERLTLLSHFVSGSQEEDALGDIEFLSMVSDRILDDINEA